MSLVYMIVEYRLVYSFIFDDDPNSRDEYFHTHLSLSRVIRLTFKNYVFGHTHVMTVHDHYFACPFYRFIDHLEKRLVETGEVIFLFIYLKFPFITMVRFLVF